MFGELAAFERNLMLAQSGEIVSPKPVDAAEDTAQKVKRERLRQHPRT